MVDSVKGRANQRNASDRRSQCGQSPCLIWFTGLSGAGKSTIASELEYQLASRFNACTSLLDGDVVREGLCRDLAYSENDRAENIRRVGEVAKLLVESGLVVVAAFISPYRHDRECLRNLFPSGRFVEVFVDVPLGVCESRDPKGLYRMARAGKILDFTGIDSPYEPPLNPDVHIENQDCSVSSCVEQILSHLKEVSLIL